MNDSWTDRLSEYLDGELVAEERTLCEAHVATCAACRTALEDLRDVVTHARALPEILPAQDLWPAVAARIAAFAREGAEGDDTRAAGGGAPHAHARPTRGRFSFTWPQLVAAGLALAALSAGASWYAAGRFTASAPGSYATAPRTSATAEPARASDADRRYAATVADLQRALEQRRDELEPQTVSTIEANLKIIDLATAQARRALAEDPGNPYLRDHLSKTMQRKVELLREATMLASTH